MWMCSLMACACVYRATCEGRLGQEGTCNSAEHVRWAAVDLQAIVAVWTHLRKNLVCRVEEIRDQDIGTKAGLFEVLKIGDEFYSFIVDCKDPKACTILLRGASKDVLNEVDYNVLLLSVPPSVYWL